MRNTALNQSAQFDIIVGPYRAVNARFGSSQPAPKWQRPGQCLPLLPVEPA